MNDMLLLQVHDQCHVVGSDRSSLGLVTATLRE